MGMRDELRMLDSESWWRKELANRSDRQLAGMLKRLKRQVARRAEGFWRLHAIAVVIETELNRRASDV